MAPFAEVHGLMGAITVFLIRHRDHYEVRDKRIGGVLAAWAGYQVLTGLAVPYIDNGAHIGGLLTRAQSGVGAGGQRCERLFLPRADAGFEPWIDGWHAHTIHSDARSGHLRRLARFWHEVSASCGHPRA